MKELLFLFFLILSGCSFENQEVSITLEDELIEIILKNQDAKEYLDYFQDAKMIYMEELTPIDVENRKEETSFDEFYSNLPQKNLIYAEFNGGSNLNLMVIVDVENKETLRAFGKYITNLG